MSQLPRLLDCKALATELGITESAALAADATFPVGAAPGCAKRAQRATGETPVRHGADSYRCEGRRRHGQTP